MSFLVEFGQSGGQEVASVADKITDSLGKVEDSSGRVREAISTFSSAGIKAGQDVADGLDQTTEAAKRASGGLAELQELVLKLNASSKATGVTDGVAGFSARELQILEQIKGPIREHNADIEALNRLHSLGQVSIKQYEEQLVRLEQQYGASNRAESLLAQSLEQEARTLDRIRGPMRAYEQEVATLDRLMKQGSITAEEYTAELDKQAKKAGVPQTESDLQGGLSSALGASGSLLTGGAIAGGVMALGHTVESLIQNYRDLQDVYINATNAAMKFADSGHSVTVIMNEQIALAHDLHSDYNKTIEVYDSVRDGTDELAISHADQIKLTQALSEEVQIAGKSMETAGHIATRFGYALASGTISTRELKTIMRDVPDIADTWTKHFDTTRAGLMAMVKAGTVGTEDLMHALIAESGAIQKTFDARERTNAQKKEEWELNEKLYAQRYDVGYGEGHATKAKVDAYKQMIMTGEGGGRDEVAWQAERESSMFHIGASPATAALKEIDDEARSAMQDMINNIVNLTGPFQELGDKLRKAQGETAAVRAEVEKIHAPIEAAKHQVEVLQQAFDAHKITLHEFTTEFQKAQTVLHEGIPDPAYALNKSIDDARKHLAMLKEDMKAGKIEGGLEVYKKAELADLTAINGGRIPENLRITAPIAQARIELAELQAQMGTLGGNSLAVRKRYDELMTTINNGRLPETIKFWEALHDPISQTTRDIAALNSLYSSGRISASSYQVELSKATEAHIKFLQSNNPSLDRKLPDLAIDTAIWEKTRDPLGLEKETLDPLGALQEKRDKLIQAEREELAKIKTPLEQYQNQIKALGELFEAQHISPARYETQIEAARAAFLAASPVALTFGEHVEQAFLKAKQAARDAGVEAKSYQRVLEEQQVARIEAKPGTRSTDDLIAVALLKDKEAAEQAGVAASSYKDVVDKVRATQLSFSDDGKSFLGGLELEWIKLEQEADKFGSTVATKLVGDLDTLNQTLVTAANGGQVSWSQMADSMIQDLERVALKALEVQAIQGLIGLVGGGGSSESSMLAGLGDELMHNATGGTYRIGGSGGTDSKIAATYITPGEYLRVQTPQQYQAETQRAPSQAPQPPPVVHIHNHLEESVVTSALASRAGQVVIANAMRKLGTGMRR